MTISQLHAIRVVPTSPPFMLTLTTQVGYDQPTNVLWITWDREPAFTMQSVVVTALAKVQCPECPRLDFHYNRYGQLDGLIFGPIFPVLSDGGNSRRRERLRRQRYDKATTLSNRVYRNLASIGIMAPSLHPEHRVLSRYLPEWLRHTNAA